jgi:hypothetical protein
MMGKRGNHTLLLCWERAAAAARLHQRRSPGRRGGRWRRKPRSGGGEPEGESSSLSLNQSIGGTGWLLSLFSLNSPHSPCLISAIPASIWLSRSAALFSRSFPLVPARARNSVLTRPERRPGRLTDALDA